MKAALRKPQQSVTKLLQTKALPIAKNAPRVLLPHSEADKRKLEIFNFVILFSSSSHITQNHRAHMNVVHVKRMLYYRISDFWVRAVCEPQLVCYYPKHASWSPSKMPFCAYFWPQLMNYRRGSFLALAFVPSSCNRCSVVLLVFLFAMFGSRVA